MPSSRDFTVMALIAAYNEADIIALVIGDLVEEGVLVYLLDHGSTDATVQEAQRHLGRGLVRIESLPAPDDGSRSPAWEQVLRRKEDLALELDADWFIHHDADEFRESPWPDLRLREAIQRVDAQGYDAIDFELLNFRPTHDSFRPGTDVREAFPYYEPGEAFDRPQIRCWKKGPQRVDLVTFGGHKPLFPGRRVFPLRFLLRHYPIRGQSHGERKVFRERKTRFAAERAQQWHIQYDRLREGDSFLHDPATLTRYDPVAVRLRVALGAFDDSGATAGVTTGIDSHAEGARGDGEIARLRERLDELDRVSERFQRELHARNLEVLALDKRLDERSREAAELHGRLDERTREASRLHGEVDARTHEAAGLRLEVAERSRERDEALAAVRGLQAEVEDLQATVADTQRRLLEVLASRTWRWSGPLRTAVGWFGRR
jgi:glycosyltransferase involved in cell wall biosynthesis